MSPTQSKSVEEPQPGDLIEIFRGQYQHWAVYVGRGYVVHLVRTQSGSAGSSGGGPHGKEGCTVKREKLSHVVGTDEWRVNNSLDKKYKPRPRGVIVKEAEDMVGVKQTYHLLTNNCEHFAKDRRYGKPESRQVHWAIMRLIGAAAAAGAAAGAALAALPAAVASAAVAAAAMVTAAAVSAAPTSAASVSGTRKK